MATLDRDTIGKIVHDLMQKEPENEKLDPVGSAQDAEKELLEGLFKAVEDGKKAFPGDFYIALLFIKVPLLKRVIRAKAVVRLAAPTPEYDQSAFHYSKSHEKLELLWSVPSKDTCNYLKFHALEVVPEERALRDFAIAFLDGTLLKQSKKLNNEKAGSNILENV